MRHVLLICICAAAMSGTLTVKRGLACLHIDNIAGRIGGAVAIGAVVIVLRRRKWGWTHRWKLSKVIFECQSSGGDHALI